MIIERFIKDVEDVFEEDYVRKIEFMYWFGKGKVIGGLYFYLDKDIDVVVLKVEGIKVFVIFFGDYLDDWFGIEFVLMEVVVLGYLLIFFFRELILVVIKVEVNVIIDKYIGGYFYFILFFIVWGGFSGGLVIIRYGCILGLVMELLIFNGNVLEFGYLVVLFVEFIYNLLFYYSIVFDYVDRLWDGFWNINLINLYDFSVFIGF